MAVVRSSILFLAVLAPALAAAGDCGESGEITPPEVLLPSDPESWEGLGLDALTRAWGQPKKKKEREDGGRGYEFRRKIFAREIVCMRDPNAPQVQTGAPGGLGGASVVRDDHGSFVPTHLVPTPVKTQAGTQKAKFVLNDQGRVVSADVQPIRWKKRFDPGRHGGQP